MATDHKPYLTPPEIAKLLRVSAGKVLTWIRRAEMTAVNVGDGMRRPRYRVSHENFELFLKSREVPAPPPRRPTQRRIPDGGELDPELGELLLRKKQAVKVFGKYYRVHDGMILFY